MNNDKCWCECKEHHICEKYYIWNPATCSFKNGKYLASITDDDSVITCDEIIEETTNSIPTSFNEKKQPVRHKISILYAFLVITILLLIAFSIYCYLIKYKSKQKHLLPFHDSNNELALKRMVCVCVCVGGVNLTPLFFPKLYLLEKG